MYHYVTVRIVMRNCETIEDATQKCSNLMPYNPDENTQHMESWEITEVLAVSPCPTRVQDNGGPPPVS